MPLEVELHLPRGAPTPVRESLTLANDGVYWFLGPLFAKLQKSHGKHIDLYGWVSFRGQALDRATAEALVAGLGNGGASAAESTPRPSR